MSLSSLTNRIVYVGDGSSATFSFPYYFFAQSDLKVYQYDVSSGSSALLALNTNYTVSGTPNGQGIYSSGANVIISSSVTNSSYIVIVRNPPETQNFVLQQNAVIPSTSLTQQLDYLTILIQRHEDALSRAVKLPDGFAGTFDPSLPTNMNAFASNGIFLNSTATGWTYGPFANSYIPNTLIYAPTGSSVASLGGGAAGLFLQSNGSSAPSWAAVSLSGSSVAGTLSLSNGGTGGLTPQTWGVVFASSATQLATTDPAPVGFALISNQSSAPTFQRLPFATAGSGFVAIANGGTGGNSYVSGSGAVQLSVYVSGSGAVLLSNYVSGSGALQISNYISGSGALLISNNLSEVVAATAFKNISPMTTTGDIIIYGSNSVQVRLPAGNSSQVFTSGGAGIQPSWQNAATGFSNPMTLFGDTLYSGSAAVATRLGAGTAGQFLTTQGANAAPSWTSQNYGSSALLVVNNLNDVNNSSTTFNNISPGRVYGDVIFTGSAIVGTRLAAGVAGQFLTTQGSSANPTWSTGLANPMLSSGDIIYGGTAGVATRLAGSVSGSTCVLIQTGSAAVSAAPVWQVVRPPVVEILSSSGTYSVQAGAIAIKVTVQAPGAGGGGAATAAVSAAAGGGGGGGGCAIKWFSGSSLSTTYAYVVGVGGAGGTAGNNGGTNGSSSVFGTVVALGGLGGGGGTAGTTSIMSSAGGAGGQPTTGDINIKGGIGTGGFIFSATQTSPGCGAGSYLGGSCGNQNVNQTATGAGGQAFGGGGGGGCLINAGSAQAGGPGASGTIVVESYFI